MITVSVSMALNSTAAIALGISMPSMPNSRATIAQVEPTGMAL